MEKFGATGGGILISVRLCELIGRGGELSVFLGEGPAAADVVGLSCTFCRLDASLSGARALKSAVSTSDDPLCD